MLIKRLHLVNFRQHANTSVKFERGLTGITGPNGAGKSTILEGILFGLYGVPATRGNKDSIKWRYAAPRSGVNVTLDFELAGHAYRVERTLTTAKLTREGVEEPIAVSLSGVTEFLTRTLGMTREEFGNTYFTGQKDLAAMTGMSSTDRAKFVSRVLGYDRLESAQQLARDRKKSLNGELNGLRAGMPNMVDIDAAMNEATTACTEAEVEALARDAEASRTARELETILPQWTQAESEQNRRLDLTREKAGAEAKATESAKQIAQLRSDLAAFDTIDSELKTLCPDVDVFHVTYEAAKQAVNALNQLAAAHVLQSKVESRRGALQSGLATLVEEQSVLEHAISASTFSAPELLARETELRTIATERQTASTEHATELADAKAAVRTIGDQFRALDASRKALMERGPDGACAACGQTLGAAYDETLNRLNDEIERITNNGTDARARVTAAEVPPPRLATLTARETDITAQIRALRDASDADSRNVQALAANQKRRDAAQKELDALNQESAPLDPYDQVEHDAKRTAVSTFADTSNSINRLRTQLAQRPVVQSRLTSAEESRTALLAAVDTAVAEMATLTVSDSQYAALRVAVDQARVASAAANTAAQLAQSQLRHWSLKLETAKTQLADFEKRRANLKRVEDDAFVHEALDKALTDFRQALNEQLRPELADVASALLDVITEGRYSEAEIDDAFNLVIVDDGEPKPVLSGGEEDVCSLVLRLAISQMIAARAGHPFSLLVLDEVFGSLDEQRRDNVVKVLRALNDRFEQVLVITHIGQVRDGLDHVIEVVHDDETKSSRVLTDTKEAA